MTPFDPNNHVLLRQMAHEACLWPTEFDTFAKAVADALQDTPITIKSVQIPDWPPVPYAPLAIIFGISSGNDNGGGDPLAWWEGRFWTGSQPAIEDKAITSPNGDWVLSSSLAWKIAKEQAGDPQSQLRCAYRWNVPIYNESEHILIRKWTETQGVDIVDFLRKWIDPLEAEGNQPILIEVTNPYIKKEIEAGSGYSPTRRVIPVELQRILNDYLENRGITLVKSNKPRPIAVPDIGKDQTTAIITTHTSIVHPDLIWHTREISQPKETPSGTPQITSIAYIGGDSPFIELESKEQLFPKNNQTLLLQTATVSLQLYAGSLVSSSLDGKTIQLFLSLENQRVLDNIEDSTPIIAVLKVVSSEEPTPAPVVLDPKQLLSTSSGLASKAQLYSPHIVKDVLHSVFGREFRLFGRQISDTAIVALNHDGVEQFLTNARFRIQSYIIDTGGRNFDCENFAEQLRCDLQTHHGVNGIGVVWGNAHAWNFFVVANNDRPMIMFVEPQTLMTVNSFTGQYSIDRRCEVLL